MIVYHPIIGITIFLLCVIFSYILGKRIVFNSKKYKKKPPTGEVSSPDAPWIKKN